MSWRRAAVKTPGWAAFDLKKRQQKGGDGSPSEQEKEESPYPLQLMSTSAVISKGLPNTAGAVQKNDFLLPPRGRSFVSVLLSNDNMEFPALPGSTGSHSSSSSGQSSTTQQSHNEFNHESDNDIVQQAVAASCSTKLKELYSWADESLIVDVMAAVDNDVNKASSLLAAMSSFESSIEQWQKDGKCIDCSNVDKGGISFEVESAGIEEFNHRGEGSLNYAADEEFCCDYDLSCRGQDSGNDAAAKMKMNLACWKKIVPAEPEWEEDDIYFVHRKEALRMTRLASRHSRAATYAYIRGDHFSAQQFSAKAREEWAAAERLNAKAAKKILSIRNGKNGPWKLDLHGLHASEAVQALQERLNTLESLVSSDRSLSPNGRNSSSKGTRGGNSSIVRCASLESLTCHVNEVKLDEESSALSSSFQQHRPASLHVITGIGNHCQGQAALPTAVRNFLNGNGYRYDEARPGLITVRPKFRR